MSSTCLEYLIPSTIKKRQINKIQITDLILEIKTIRTKTKIFQILKMYLRIFIKVYYISRSL
jgi:hypothetical protein